MNSLLRWNMDQPDFEVVWHGGMGIDLLPPRVSLVSAYMPEGMKRGEICRKLSPKQYQIRMARARQGKINKLLARLGQ